MRMRLFENGTGGSEIGKIEGTLERVDNRPFGRLTPVKQR